MTAPASPSYAALRKHLRETATLASVGSLLAWDQETYMPAGGAAHRAEQQAMVAALAHQRATDRKVADLLAACESDGAVMADARSAANVREARREYDRATKLPESLVAEFSRTCSLAQEAWKEARQRSDFGHFAPWLEKVMALTRRKAECYGAPPGGELYDAMLDQYEPGMRAAQVEAIFGPLRKRLAALVSRIAAAPRRPGDRLLSLKAPAAQQQAFGEAVLAAMGFDLKAGRLDTTAHPFCESIGPGDTRLTTRYTTDSFLEPLFGTMHEAGHGLYEQGLPKAEHFGEPLADSISLGVHESQSRMWENFVGRSREFWTWALPVARRCLSPLLDQVTVDEIYGAANVVEPSHIRVEADEATYNLHIMLRFGLEREMVAGSLAIKDLPGEWNRRFKDLLGIDVPDDRRGCLQDVHWSFGLVGYFPTYTLGNLYAAQMWEKINADLPGLRAGMARGEFAPLKHWLNEKVHAHGRRYKASELCEVVTGSPLSADPLLRHLEGKLAPLYGL
ncbi:MAG: carboxypeptidase M32 [Phycisphaeraceae bacterium]|nr:carboxypeptidase M32 [Phycisphaeraceae bacterium]